MSDTTMTAGDVGSSGTDRRKGITNLSQSLTGIARLLGDIVTSPPSIIADVEAAATDAASSTNNGSPNVDLQKGLTDLGLCLSEVASMLTRMAAPSFNNADAETARILADMATTQSSSRDTGTIVVDEDNEIATWKNAEGSRQAREPSREL